MEVHNLCDQALLSALIGPRSAERILKDFNGCLAPLVSDKNATSQLNSRQKTRLLAARELVRRVLTEELTARDLLSSPKVVAEYLRLHFAGREYESFVVLFLDTQNALLASEEMFRGTLNQTSVYPREVIKRALFHNAAKVIFAHNHPSGVAEPSRADELLTETLKRALALVDVCVNDHFIVCGNASMSFAEKGLL